MERIIIAMILIFSGIITSGAREYTPSDVPNVQIQDRNRFVSDPDGILTDATRTAIDWKLREFSDSSTAEFTVVILESIGNYDSAEFAQELFDKWGIGKRDKDNGVLLLIAMESHDARIHTGYGVEGALPDISAMKILRSKLFPKMREGDTDGAVTATVDAICSTLSDPAVADELKSEQRTNATAGLKPIEKSTFLYAVGVSATIIFFCGLFVLIIAFIKCRKLDSYHKTLFLNNTTRTMLWISLFSAGAALPLALIAWLSAKRSRNRPHKCRRCGTRMNKLSEEADNAYLNPAQDFEEKLNSVDYDVWMCPRCEFREIFSYNNSRSSYKECPSCHTRAYRSIGSRTLQSPTTLREGMGEKIFECRYCGHKAAEKFTIPKIVTPVIVRHGRGGFGGGGGFSGGGFGGGRSGGGGAGGRW